MNELVDENVAKNTASEIIDAFMVSSALIVHWRFFQSSVNITCNVVLWRGYLLSVQLPQHILEVFFSIGLLPATVYTNLETVIFVPLFVLRATNQHLSCTNNYSGSVIIAAVRQ